MRRHRQQSNLPAHTKALIRHPEKVAHLSPGSGILDQARPADIFRDQPEKKRTVVIARTAAIPADFTLKEDIDRLAVAAWEAFGGIEGVLLSSQPAQPAMGNLLSTSDEDWQRQQMAIAWGPFRLLKQLAPKMMDAGGASIITLTSSTAEEPIRGYGAYGLAKSALWTLTRYMAAEWGQYGIRANSICPGMIATGGPGAPNQPPPSMLSRTSLRRTGRNEEVTGAAVYLASDESSFTSGQCITVNGGRF